MHISEVAAFRYRLPLTAPLPFGAPGGMDVREGMLVCVADTGGHVGWGDVAPLSGFSEETLEDAVDALQAVARSLVGTSGEEASRIVASRAGPSSVRFGLELALFDRHAHAEGMPLPQVLNEAPRDTVSFNGLLTEEGQALREAASRLQSVGYRAVKLKVGRRAVAEDVVRVRDVHACAGDVALRLDANRAWSLDAARRFAEGVAGVPIEYIEEPLADPTALRAFAAETGLPVALDETIQAGAHPADHPYATAIILKPTLVGGIGAAKELARQAAHVSCTPVLSAAFESGVGLRGLVALAAGLTPRNVSVGLDTYSRLGVDVFQPRLPLNGPCVHITSLMAAERSFNAHVIRLDNPVVSHPACP